MSALGVGPVTALTFKAGLEDPGRFERSCDVGAYAGLVPRRNQSGTRDYKGHISKAGDPMLRHAFYEAANSTLSRLKRPCALQSWGKRLAEAKGAKRARVVVARNLAANPPHALALGNHLLLDLTAADTNPKRQIWTTSLIVQRLTTASGT